MKVNRIAILMGVVGLVYGTSSNAFYNVDAALTAPTSYNIAYRWNGTTQLFELQKKDSIHDAYLGFDRTGFTAPYTFHWESGVDRFDGGSGTTLNDILPVGFSIYMEFNKSNTDWTEGVSANAGYYFPGDAGNTPSGNHEKIGSDNTVGSVNNKVYLKFNNQTNKDYRIILDISSTPNQALNNIEVNDDNVSLNFYAYTPVLNYISLNAFTSLEIYFNGTSGARYFDAWYLVDLGISDSWNNGYDEGYDDGENAVIASGGLQGIIEGVFDGIVAIFGLEIFNGVSLGAVALFPLVITLFVFVMKIVKMGG